MLAATPHHSTFCVWYGQSFGKPSLPLGHVWLGKMRDSHLSPCYQFVRPLVVLFAFAKFQINPWSVRLFALCADQKFPFGHQVPKVILLHMGKKDTFLWLEARHSHLLVCTLYPVASNTPKAKCHEAYRDWKSPGSRTEALAVIPNSL